MPAIQIDKETALRMANLIDTDSIVNLLTVKLQGSIITNAVENSMDWVDKFFRWFGIFNLGKLNFEQRTKLSDEINNRILLGVYEALTNDNNILKELEETLTKDIETEIKKIIAEETCAYL